MQENAGSKRNNYENKEGVMQRVGITGQAGFMGSHLYNYLKNKANIELIPFEDYFFEQKDLLENFVKNCDVLVHLAALNRHEDPQVIYDTNLKPGF